MSKLSLWRTICLVFIFGLLGVGKSPAATFSSLFSFNGGNGQWPWGTLVQGFNGNLYGTTASNGGHNGGTVFEFTRTGKVLTLYRFCSQKNSQGLCLDGAGPNAGLVQATDGNLYGTTLGGGATDGGTVFKITPEGALTTLYSFCSETTSQGLCTDGSTPEARLAQAADGNFYGTTYLGGTQQGCPLGAQGCGTVFEITSAGKLTTLHSFTGTDGSNPAAGLVQGADGNLYGTASGGDITVATVFKITPAGALTTLYSFCAQPGCADGYEPLGGLVQGADGNFYGTTSQGGAYNKGTEFEITPDGALTTLHNFQNAKGPNTDLVLATEGDIAINGSLWSTTRAGGTDAGTIFGLYLGGKLITRYDFCSQAGCADGKWPQGLMQATNGKFYGMTHFGGANSCQLGVTEGCGTIFSLAEGFGPFVETLPASGTIGTTVIILGNNLTGTTGVTFNGTPASFSVVSNTEISTTVPSGATTGEVQVTTPTRTLTSNVNFRVS